MKQGRWIRISGNIATDDIVVYKCSECGALSDWNKGDKGIYPGDYCNNCQAEMVSRRTAVLDGA